MGGGGCTDEKKLEEDLEAKIGYFFSFHATFGGQVRVIWDNTLGRIEKGVTWFVFTSLRR